MSGPVLVSGPGGERGLGELRVPLDLDALVPGAGRWEAELGFGKGRFLRGRAAAEPGQRFLGIEVAGHYYRIARDRTRRRGLRNLLLVRGEARYLLCAVLPVGFAAAVHVYFPDPWPKARHQRRRLFDPDSVDLILGLLEPGGCLYFATDHLEYGAAVRQMLRAHPAVLLEERSRPWEGCPRTNYEAKYEAEGRPILRFEGRLSGEPSLVHPAGEAGIVAAHAPRRTG